MIIMESIFRTSKEELPLLKHGRSRSINAENPHGEKGKGAMSASVLGAARKGSPCLKNLAPGSTTLLADIAGAGVIRHIWFTVDSRTSDADRFVLRDLVLKMYWDGEEMPSVEVPLGDFFGCGFGEDYFINSAPIVVAPARGLNCYFPMPFTKEARIELVSEHRNPIPALFYQIDYMLYDEIPAEACYFHAQWRREKLTEKAKDYTILDGVSGQGHYVGTCLYLAALERYWYGEGEVKFYIDGDREYPTVCSTGTEDYFGGSWSFAKQENGRTVEQTYCTPYLGYPYYSHHDVSLHNAYHNDDIPPQRSFYRWHFQDPICFDENLRVTIQQIGVGYGGLFERQDDVSSVAYWYQKEPHNRFPALPPARERWPR